MTLFVVIGALLALLSLALLTRPLWRGGRHRAQPASDSPALAALRQQLDQLSGLHKPQACSVKRNTPRRGWRSNAASSMPWWPSRRRPSRRRRQRRGPWCWACRPSSCIVAAGGYAADRHADRP